MSAETLESKLAFAIRYQLCGYFDHWFPGADQETTARHVAAAEGTSHDIAKKLAGAIARRPVLNEKDWRDLVLAATESAVLELADGNGYLVPARDFQSRGRTR